MRGTGRPPSMAIHVTDIQVGRPFREQMQQEAIARHVEHINSGLLVTASAGTDSNAYSYPTFDPRAKRQFVIPIVTPEAIWATSVL